MVKLKSIEGLFFLCFLTNYVIPRIYFYLDNYETIDELIIKENLDKEISEEILNTSNLSYQKTLFNNIQIIPFYEKNYPSKLNILKDKPPMIFIKGNYDPNYEMINVVGTRHNSEYGMKLTKKITKFLVVNKFGITSGLALGIDTYAHKYTLEENGYTVAILPTPLNTIYPKENYELANQILKNNGALITELPIDLNMGKRNFVQRNRIQAALSKLTIPIEMNKTSGTMHTVEFTIKQDKYVILINLNINNEIYVNNFNEVYNYLINKKNKFYKYRVKIIKDNM